MATREIATKTGTYSISYLLDQGGKTKVLFLHGWGANKELMRNAFAPFMTDRACLYMDLAGFGKSSSHTALDSYGYLEIVREFLTSIDFVPDTIVGHSFGGKIATLLNPPKLVLLSSAGIVKQKSLKVRCKIRLAKIFGFLKLGFLTKLLRTKDATNLPDHMYQTLKNVVDEDFSTHFANRKLPTIIFWGKDDTATPLISGKRIHNLISGSQFIECDGDHFFFLKHAKTIANQLK